MKKNGTLPSTRLILGYKDLTDEAFTANRISLLDGVSKPDALAEIAGLNFRLKGRKAKEIDSSLATQMRELWTFSGRNRRLYRKYARLIDQKAQGKKVYLFSRQACLFALEEITQSDLPVIENFKMSTRLSSWEALIRYLLAVNDEITKIEKSKPSEAVNFETLNPKMLPISELMLINDPFYIIHRGWHLMEFLHGHDEVRDHIVAYFQDTYQLDYEQFIFELHRMWIANGGDREDFNFFYILNPDEPSRHVFDKMSEKFESKETFKLLNIRKNPFFKFAENKYVLTDVSNLQDKSYQQFINDFFFDKLRISLKTNGKPFTMQDYKAIIGYFFESYVKDIIQYCFSGSRGYTIRMFDELKTKLNNQSTIEVGDLYIRKHNNILFAEVKSSSMYDAEKYGGNIDAMYKNDRAKFFKSFGVDQLVTNIKNIRTNFSVIDPGLADRKKIKIWPVIIFNEKAFQTPLMAHVFNQRFGELIKDFTDRKIHVYPLTLVHISDLENMETTLKKKPNYIWHLLSTNFRNPSRFIPPFYSTLGNVGVRAGYERIMKRISRLFKKEDNGGLAPSISAISNTNKH